MKKFYRDLSALQRLYPVSKWIMRICLLIYVLATYLPRFQSPDISSEYFWLAIVYTIFAVLLFIGGFQRISNLTRLAALFLFVAALIHLSASLLIFRKVDELYSTKLMFFSIIIYFLTSSKRQEKPPRKASSASGLFDETEDEGAEPLVSQ